MLQVTAVLRSFKRSSHSECLASGLVYVQIMRTPTRFNPTAPIMSTRQKFCSALKVCLLVGSAFIVWGGGVDNPETVHATEDCACAAWQAGWKKSFSAGILRYRVRISRARLSLIGLPFVLQLQDCLKSYGRGDESSYKKRNRRTFYSTV